MALDRNALLGELTRSHDGSPWHGPSRAAVLEGITPRQAAWRPAPDAHSIWEIVLHMRNWTREVIRRAQGGEPGDPVDGDWPDAPAPTAAEWRRLRASLDAAHEELVALVRAMSDEALIAKVRPRADDPDGHSISHRAMFLSLAQHDIYHTGQVAMLKRLASRASAS